MTKKHYLITFSLVLTSIFATYFAANQTAQQSTTVKSDYDYQTNAVLFMQKSAEYRALCLQAFNWAKRGIDEDEKLSKKLPKAERKKPRAVVVDIDETMLDNSPAQAAGIKLNKPFTYPDWYAWGKMRKAKAIPGAVEFADYAKSKNVRVFYVSNRDENPQLEDTIENLRLAGFPDVSKENVLLRIKDAEGKNISTKEPRRLAVAEKHRIVSLIGDNLNDLAKDFENQTITGRFGEVEKVKDWWGNKFIVLPNAMYGEWETLIYKEGTPNTTSAEKRANALELP
jgi:5'-nucleotidase (lipoprotein e(P4) family)